MFAAAGICCVGIVRFAPTCCSLTHHKGREHCHLRGLFDQRISLGFCLNRKRQKEENVEIQVSLASESYKIGYDQNQHFSWKTGDLGECSLSLLKSPWVSGWQHLFL